MDRWAGRWAERTRKMWREQLPPPVWDASQVHSCSAQPPPPEQDSALKALGTEGLFLFSSLDTDGDMYLSPEEFKPIAEKLTGTGRGWGLGRREPGHRPLLLALCLLCLL